jgi:hypothetical protein
VSSATITAPTWTTGPSVGKWFAGNLPHVKGELAGQPFVLHAEQQADVDLIWECTKDGRRVWRDVTWSVAKGYGKTPISAGGGLCELVTRTGAPEVYVAAGSKDQAGITIDYARKMVDGVPLPAGGIGGGALRGQVTALGRAKLSPLKCLANGGVMIALASDGDLGHGVFPAASLLDELWVWVSEKQESMYTGLLSATQKVVDSLMLAITTVGAKWTTLLGELFEAFLATMEFEWDPDAFRLVGRDVESDRLLIWRTAPTERIAKIVGCDVADPTDPAVWRKCNPGPWISDRDLRRLAKTLPGPRFRQLILNQWPDGKGGTLLVPADWDACAEDYAPIDAGAPVWLGVSISPDRRSGALLIVSRRSDERIVIAQRIHEAVDQDALKVTLEADVRWAATRWDHQALAADKWQFGSQMDALAGDGIRLYKGTSAGQPGMPQTDAYMIPATGELIGAVTGKRLLHDGDRILRRHVTSLETKIADRGHRLARPTPVDESAGMELDEHRKPQVVEAGFALAMALYAMESGDVQLEGGIE